MRRAGQTKEIRGRYYVRIRVGKGMRPTVALSGCSTWEEAEERAKVVAALASRLVESGRPDLVRVTARRAGAAKTERELAALQKGLEIVLKSAARPATEVAFDDLAKLWMNGDLHRRYPDHVKAKRSFKNEKARLHTYIYPVLKGRPITTVTLDDAETVMASLPSSLASATRRQVAQILHKILSMAVYPVRILKASPLPKGFLPKIKSERARPWLYPAEECQLMAAGDVPISFRLFYGILAREGMRASELASLTWESVDLRTGIIRLDQNKTDEPRAWVLGADTLAAFDWIKRSSAKDSSGPFVDLPMSHIADALRNHLEVAKVRRPELFERSKVRLPLRIHDLRGSFVTLALATGRTEAWGQDRTGHKSTLMIARYRRAARSATELRLTWWADLRAVVPELGGVGQGWANSRSKPLSS